MKFRWKTLLIIVVLLGAAGGAGAWHWHKASKPLVVFRVAAVTRGELTATISATGTIEPEEVVDVGAQVQGQVLSFGQDPSHPGRVIDYCSQVKEGTVLARIDDSLYAADVQTAQAQLDQDKAGVELAQANLQLAKAKLYDAQRDWERAQKIGPSDALAETDYDAYQATYETAKATVGVNAAALDQAKTLVTAAQAALLKAEKNLGYCTITSPVTGVVIDRRVNIGETVVSSLNTPSLFLIAKDLTRMQIWIAVNEADIGSIHPGQAVIFTVDAYPGRTFKGEVGKIRLNATMTQNVVTYTVEVNTDNSSGKLLPYQTANAQFQVSHETDVLLVPNAALRWSPQLSEVAPEDRDAFIKMSQRKAGGRNGGGGAAGGSGGSSDSGKPVATTERSSGYSGGGHERGTIWVTDDGIFVKMVKVRIGATDGTNTVVTSDKLQEDQQVVIGEMQAGENGSDTTNPFAPQMFRGGGMRR